MSARPQSVLHPGGWDAEVTAHLAWVLIGGAALAFAGVMVVCALGLRRQREVRPRRWLLGAGVALPSVALLALLLYSVWRGALLSEVSSRQTVRIAVVAHMWWWEVRYTDPTGGADIVLANEIRLPVGQPVYLGLSSADVIHSFWAPALAGKVDMVPGRVHGLMLRARQPGVYRVQCAEYCGEQHARMALHVVALGEREFAAWLAAQALPARANASANASANAAGRRVFEARRCAACHTVRGVGDHAIGGAGVAAGTDGGGLGPDLTHVGSRLYLGAGTLRNGRAALRQWIADPHHLKPGVRMPASTDMSATDLQALAAWLEALQ
ncbi:cytochrome c oxidase subunit II [Duganella callida]|uniref:C-type cytochrome n=1 Tax=Duganella callida TaxID=2561932 RepID=A0A4Y9SIF3_9BURK|nr:c-type cytochrome [Duganella callida]TFW20466.1 c-type cytochrome [Duganella callida]